jgi:hypothetical protein
VRRVLILGGYGGFGARLSRRLAQDGWAVLVAGRNQDKASAFASGLPNASGIFADRNGDLAGLLVQHKPDLVIDAAGPFQGSDYHVPKACIAAAIDYLDLADARDFVGGIGALHASAESAGVRVIAGASSVPALSGAVLRELCADMDAVASVDMAISASNRATAGPSVAAAILSYAGKPLRLWHGQRWQTAYGWQEIKRIDFAADGLRPIRRRVALADIPDHDLVPDNLPGRPATRFYAGPEFSFQLLAIAALSWLVRWGWLASLTPLARWLLPLQRLTGWAGSDRSAMWIEAKGRAGDALLKRRWTLIAEAGDGPEIPVLAAQLLAQKYGAAGLATGAYNASKLLQLSDFQPLFDALAIKHQHIETAYTPLYQRVMGADFDALPDPVRFMHTLIGDGAASGTATVTRGRNWAARLVAWVMRFPPEGQHDVHVHFAEQHGRERWTRDFDGARFSSALSECDGLLFERFGPMRFHFTLAVSEGGLRMMMQKWRIFGLPMPLALAPKSPAREWAEGDDFCFDVPITLPLIGMVVHYQGRLRLL